MSQPDWAAALHVLYQKNGAVPFPDSGEEFQSDNPLVSDTNLSESEIEDVTDYLEEMGLVEYDYSTLYQDSGYTQPIRTGVSLTPDGFSVGHERDLRNRQQELVDKQTQASHVVAALTVVLALSAAIRVIVEIPNLSQISQYMVGLLAILAVLIAGWLLARVDII